MDFEKAMYIKGTAEPEKILKISRLAVPLRF